MGYFLASLIDSSLFFAARKFAGNWGWRGFTATLFILLVIWLLLMATR